MKYTIFSVDVDFPFKPYPSQMAVMSKVITALKTSSNAIIESPTGTGKTLSLLCPSLAFQEQFTALKLDESNAGGTDQPVKRPMSDDTERKKENLLVGNNDYKSSCGEEDDAFMPASKMNLANFPVQEDIDSIIQKIETSASATNQTRPKIYFGTRTHKQISQIVKELRMTKYTPRMAILSSRQQLCINGKVRKQTNMNDGCMQLLENGGCSYMEKAKNVAVYKPFRSGEDLELYDIEDLVTAGKKVRGCPYFATRIMSVSADIVFCPYNYLIDVNLRESLGLNLKNTVVIIDEAHNIEDACRSAASWEIKDPELSNIIKCLNDARGDELVYKEHHESISFVLLLVESLNDWLSRNSNVSWTLGLKEETKVWGGSEFASMLNESAIKAETIDIVYAAFMSLSNLRNDNSFLSLASIHSIKSLLRILRHIFFVDCEDYKLAITKNLSTATAADWKYQLNIWCLNPSVSFKLLEKDARSVILASGTLSPLSSFKHELGSSFPNVVEANHVINKSQVMVSIIKSDVNGKDVTGTFKHVESFDYQDSIGEIIIQVCKLLSFGVLVFFSSYGLVERLENRWKVTGLWKRLQDEKKIFVEPKGDSIDPVIAAYYDAVPRNNGALFLAVYRGKISEGIDFSNEYARAVITIGIPYPHLSNTEVKLKREYNDRIKSGGFTGSQWYETQAFRAYNQALGRCIRHSKDWGALIMVDSRLCQARLKAMLPRWIREKTISHPSFDQFKSDLNRFICEKLEEPSTINK